jgi:hypothetical protein
MFLNQQNLVVNGFASRKMHVASFRVSRPTEQPDRACRLFADSRRINYLIPSDIPVYELNAGILERTDEADQKHRRRPGHR